MFSKGPSSFYYIFILCILSFSCGLIPLTYQKEDINSTVVQSIETKETTIILEYIRSQYGHYIFDLEIINHSESVLSFAPQRISHFASTKLFTPIRNATDNVYELSAPNSVLAMKRQFANNPRQTKTLYQEKVKSKESFNILFGVLGAGLIIYDGVKDSKDNQKETWTKRDENKAATRDALVSMALITSDISSQSVYQAEEDNYYLPFELFPECNIQPNSSVRGKIFIPIETPYRYSRVVVPLLDTDFVFDFRRNGARSPQTQ